MLSSCSSGGRSKAHETQNHHHHQQQRQLPPLVANHHHHQQPKQQKLLKHQRQHQSQLELLANVSSEASDNLEASGASGHSSDHSSRSLLIDNRSNGSSRNNNNQNLSNGQQFINADGSIFALASNVMLEQQQHQGKQSLSSSSSSSVSKELPQIQLEAPPPPLPGSNAPLEHSQHRRLQYQPIHQKLQRIYGNKLQEFEHQQEQTRLANRQQAPALPSKQEAAMIKNQHQHHHHRAAETVNYLNDEHQFLHQHNLQHQQQQKPVTYHHHHEQTYDSLSPPVQAAPLLQQQPMNQTQQQQRKLHLHQHFVQQHQAQICAIPEEEVDLNNNHLNMQSRHHHRHHRHHHHQNHHGENLLQLEDDIDQSTDELEDEGEYEDDVCNVGARQKAPLDGGNNMRPLAIKKAPSSILIDNRKKHLESLHYATATAAALLNVTASAAAAFAASEKQLNKQRNPKSLAGHQQQMPQPSRPQPLVEQVQPQIKRPKAYVQQKQQAQPQIYSETYQDINSNQQLYQTHPDARPMGTQPEGFPKPANLIKSQQAARSMSFRHHQHHQQQQQIYHIHNPQKELYQSRAQLQMAAAVTAFQRQGQQQQFPLTMQQVDILRQLQLQKANGIRQAFNTNVAGPSQNQQLVPPALAIPSAGGGAPALAILHRNGKLATNLDIDLISKLANQQQQQQQLQRNKQKQAYLQYAAGIDPRLLAAQGLFAQVAAVKKAQEASRQPKSLGNTTTNNKQQVTYGLLIANGEKKSAQQQIYSNLIAQAAPPAPIQKPTHLHLASGASSDASGHTNLPLIFDRRLERVGFVEKICQIDLKLFWWSLLTICLIFIATVVTITRHVF